MGYKMYAGLIMGCVLADIVIVEGTLQSLGNGTYSFQNRNIYDGTLLPGDLITVRPFASHLQFEPVAKILCNSCFVNGPSNHHNAMTASCSIDTCNKCTACPRIPKHKRNALPVHGQGHD